MTIMDKQALLSDDQAVTSTAASTNYIDLGTARDIGIGVPIPLLIQVTTAATAAGAATVTFDLEVDDNTSFSSATTVWTSGAVGKATLVAGYKLPIQYVPRSTNERYVRINYTVATGPLTAGNFTAGITGQQQDSFSG